MWTVFENCCCYSIGALFLCLFFFVPGRRRRRRREMTTPGGGSRRRDAFVACLFLVALLRYLFDIDSSTSSSSIGFTTKGVIQFEKRWEVVRRRGGTTKGGGRPPLPVAFFDLNGDGRGNADRKRGATVGVYDGSERRTSSSTLEKMMRSDIAATVEDVVVVVVCDETPRAIFAPRWKW